MTKTLKEKLRALDPVVGTFIKTPSPVVVEVLAHTPLDCLCLDAEHAPFDRFAIDAAVLAGRAYGAAVLVRVPSSAGEHLLNALDCGADGVVVPHIRSAADAHAVVRACLYGPGGRGYAGSSRAAGYTTRPMAEHRSLSNARTVLIVQIEDVEGVDDIEAIAAIGEIDALFIGRADLAVAYGVDSIDDAIVRRASDKICAAGARVGKAVGVFIGDIVEAEAWRARGATFFLHGSDQAFMLSGARALMARAARLLPG